MADTTPTPGGPMNLGPMEIGLIVLAILLLFGYKKLPDASRSLGRSLRIFKGEMKGMKDDDVRTKDAATVTPPPSPPPQTWGRGPGPRRPGPPRRAPAPSRPARRPPPTAPADRTSRRRL